MFFDGTVPTNPAELAVPHADVVLAEPKLVGGEEEERTLVYLDRLAEQADMHTQYFLEASIGYVFPMSFDGKDNVTGVRLGEGVSARVNFCTYSILKIGKIAHAESAVRALCLAFDYATLLPYMENIGDSDLLHVPVLSVDEMVRSEI